MQVSLSLRSLVALAALAFAAGAAQADPVALTKLTGLAGGGAFPATAVYKASLGVLPGSVAAISISDASGGFGGAAGQFTGSDLAAITLATTAGAAAACAQAAGGLSVFDFISGIVFGPGTQRAPADAKLFGTGAAGTTVDDAVATLGLFDAVSSTGPDAAGFLSLGDNGSIAFNLTALVSTAGLYLYIGEVGDNGEVAGSNINLLQNPVPEPSTYALMLAGLGAIGWLTRYQRRQRHGGR